MSRITDIFWAFTTSHVTRASNPCGQRSIFTPIRCSNDNTPRTVRRTVSRRKCVGSRTRSSGFTLIEMIVATVLAAVLLAAVLEMIAGVSRDRKTLSNLNTARSQVGVEELLRWDLCNARTVATDARTRSIVLVGLGGIDPQRFSPNGRFVQITYQIQSGNLWRTQEYLDDPANAGLRHELVAENVQSFFIDSNSGLPAPTAAHVHCHLVTANNVTEWSVWTR